MVADAYKEFMDVFPVLAEELLTHLRSIDIPQNAIEWFEKSMRYNVLGGKMNRGLTVAETLRILKRGETLTKEEAFKANLLGWCIEWLQAFFLVSDDIMDNSKTRRGQPCWYRVENVGMIAINDAFILEAAIYFFLKKHFRKDDYYIDLLELFHETAFQTELGQLCDLITAPEDNVDLTKFSIEKHAFIVRYKTAYYSFYLPVALGMHMAGVKDETAYKQAEDILLPLGEYFQIQDDYLDCYGNPETIGKIGTDIEDNKCSWLINQALAKATSEQRKILDENYGRRDEANVAAVKEVFKQIDVEGLFKAYEEESYSRINALIAKVDHPLLSQDVFTTFMKRIYKRTK
ncbi:Farnesyl pyrophosphate synthetase [Lobosporangium transversale]|uniref:Geranyltranstransferase n=1 Tax=Lobosporangium transversale TaxID=64571 RepID=A0A1Y2GSF2_9FUNG|nr:geranyltranstransferase [Lobosporangium transversale]KAF9917642.1 Farnesyl pyrophosphate synthetase [Lobosporangium transversale]ORZ21741.1 geranyltranstransferase [Lobosporangium transversale]|eukprot:XP_021882992.1 geranyltranstransferase [Lobosporangium transversale]